MIRSVNDNVRAHLAESRSVRHRAAVSCGEVLRHLAETGAKPVAGLRDAKAREIELLEQALQVLTTPALPVPAAGLTPVEREIKVTAEESRRQIERGSRYKTALQQALTPTDPEPLELAMGWTP